MKAKTEAEIRDELDSGGSWGAAVELIAEHGLVRASDISQGGKDADADADADKALAALGAMAKSLASGLSKPEALEDDELVRRELDRAFAFPRSLPVRRAEEVVVRLPRADGTTADRPLTDAIGTRAADNPDEREKFRGLEDVTLPAGF